MTRKNSLVKNASILMVASMISRIIGLIYRRPLGEIVGAVGLGYYGYASNLYATLLLISSYSIPMAVSKIVSERIAVGEYRNANKVFKGALLYSCIVGGVTALMTWFGGSLLLPQNQQNAVPALRVLAPTIFLSAILGVFRGYFQAYRSMAPTSISQIMEQVVNALISILAAWLLVRTFAGASAGSAAVFGAMGGTLGTAAGVLTGLLFMLMVYAVNRGYFARKIEGDWHVHEESYQDIFRVILLMITPIIFTTFIQNASNYLDSYIYASVQGFHGMNADAVSVAYGEFSNYFQPVVGIPTALASAGVAAMMPEISGSYARGDHRAIEEHVNKTIRLTMFLCIPAMVGMTVLASPVMGVLFPDSNGTAARLMLVGSLYVLTGAMTMITSGVLQAIGRQKIAVINAAIALAFNMISLAVMLLIVPAADIYAVAFVNFVSSLVCSGINLYSVKRYVEIKTDLRTAYLDPAVASVGMGAAAAAVYYGLFYLIRRPFICLVLSVFAGVLVYAVLYVAFGRVGENELARFPMGRKLVRFMYLLRIYR